MRWTSAELEELDLAIRGVFPHETVALEGQWATSRRRTYQTAQSRPGVGPFVDVLDMNWTGSLAGTSPLAAVVFLASAAGIHWVKSGPATLSQPVRLSLCAYADYSPNQATLGASVGNAHLPGVPVAFTGSPAGTCAISASLIVTGCVSVLASADRADILVLPIQAGLIRIGRNRLWRLRDDFASMLPPRAREVLTRRRTGSMSVGAGAER